MSPIAPPRRRHRVVLDLTLREGCTPDRALIALMTQLHGLVGSRQEITHVRPMSYTKVVAAEAREQNEAIRAELETAIDAVREARRRLG